MDYASVQSWINEFQAVFSSWESWQLIAPTSTRTAGEFVAELSANSIARLKACTEKPNSTEAETLDLVWWMGQSLKKFRLGTIADERATYDGFLARNAACKDRVIPFQFEARMRQLLAGALSHFGDSVEVEMGRFGPGAVAERLNNIQKWNVADQFSYDIRLMTLVRGGAWSKITPARLCCVPKNFDAFRLITIEGVENSFGQQYTRNCLARAIHRGPLRGTVMDSIDSSWDEETARWQGGSAEKIQRNRCLLGSRTGKTATLDMKNGSDLQSYRQVHQVMPPLVMSYLDRFRTPSFIVKGETHEMFMYAGMGNATTFIVETLVFWAGITAISEWLGDYTPVTVFGDDIICGNRAANHPLFEDTLKKFGWTLNMAKCGTSTTPGFRESCGLCAVAGTALTQLIRINGFDLSDPSSRIDACSLVNTITDAFQAERNWQSVLKIKPLRWAQLGLTSSLATDLVNLWKVPNLPRLRGECMAVNQPYAPYDDVPHCFSNEEGAAAQKVPCNWTTRYKVLTKEPKPCVVPCGRHLTHNEMLGVLSGSLVTANAGKKRLALRAHTRETRVVCRWVETRDI